jgi:hypothetical protein
VPLQVPTEQKEDFEKTNANSKEDIYTSVMGYTVGAVRASQSGPRCTTLPAVCTDTSFVRSQSPSEV